ncbi:MAG: tetratricopeptide repeat protein [Cyclobacteriaceae bacterium]
MTRFATCFLLSFACSCFGQSIEALDSLKLLLSKNDTGVTARIESYLEIGEIQIENEALLSLAYLDSAEALIQSNEDFNDYLSRLYLLKGKAYNKQSIHPKAQANLDIALRYIKQYPNTYIAPRIYAEMAVVAEKTSEMVKALKFNQKAIDLYTIERDTAGILESYINIGVIYWDKKEYKQAMSYYKKAIVLNNSIGNTVSNARLTNNIGLIYKSMGDDETALTYFFEALGYLDQEKHKFGYALINNNIGISYRELKQYNLALKHFGIAKTLQKEFNDLYGLALVNDNISRVYFRLGQYDRALQHLTEAETYAEQANNLDLLNDIAEHLAELYERTGDYKSAYLQQKKAQVYNDSLQAKSLSNELAELEVRYQVQQQQAENDLLKAQNELSSTVIKNKDFIIAASIVFSVLILTLLFLAYRALRIKQKTNAIVADKRAKLEQLNIEVEKQNKSIAAQKEKIERQNQELSKKNQYLEELNYEKNSLMAIVAHDLKSPLNSIKGITGILPSAGSLNAEQQEFIGLIDNVVDSSRVLIQDLMDLSALENKEIRVQFRPVRINELLRTCCSKYKAQAAQKGIGLTIQELADEHVIIQSDELFIERILQNLISNAIKFSESDTDIKIGSRIAEHALTFYVHDQGPGISDEEQKLLFKKFHKLSARPTRGEVSTGLGLSIVKVLMEELGGTMHVQSELGKGSIFTCSLPL